MLIGLTIRGAGEQWIPASLSAARFDVNSFRHLTHLLQTLGLSHYTGKYFHMSSDRFGLI